MKRTFYGVLFLVAEIFLLVITSQPASTLASESFVIQDSAKGDLNSFHLSPVNSSPSLTAGYLPFLAPGDSPHGDYNANTDSCAGCHHTHTNLGKHLQAAWPEEAVCFVCHSITGSATFDIQAAFTTFSNSQTAFYSHPVEMSASAHLLVQNETMPSAFADGNRHVECVDCHNPHTTLGQISLPPILQAPMGGTTGVEPVYNGAGAPGGYMWVQSAAYEYQVCFKCHSSFTTLPNYQPDGWDGSRLVANGLAKLTNTNAVQAPDRRDMAFEFNPDHNSFHPVIATGKNLNIPADSFVNGLTIDSLIYCSSCHGNPLSATQGNGPHGVMLHILKETGSYSTVWSGQFTALSGAEVCFSCHNFDVYVSGSSALSNTNFRKGARNLHSTHADNGSCYACHDSHGSEQLHLINLDASINDIPGGQLSFQNGYDGNPTNSQTFWQISPDGTTKTCFITCHNRPHNTNGKRYSNLFD